MTQLSEEYDVLHENITQTSRVLQQKKQAIPDLKTAFKEATLRFEEASKAREQKRKADELKKEMAWAHVAAKEDVSGSDEPGRHQMTHSCSGNAKEVRRTR